MQIRKYTSQDLPELLALIRAVHGENVYAKAIQRFKWQYEENPHNTSADPLILVLEVDDKVVGMIGAFAQKLKILDADYPAFWVGDYMVHPDFRGVRNGLNLAKKIIQQPYLLMGFPAENTMNLWLRAGAMPCSQLAEYTKITRMNTSRKGLKIFTKCVNAVWECFDRLADSLSQVPNEIKIIEIHRFDERFDHMWERISKDYKVLQVRDSKFLNWRFFKCPHLSYRVLVAVKNEAVLGYIVLRDKNYNGSREGNIVDLFTGRSDRMTGKALMDKGVGTLKDIGCNVIKMTVSSDDHILKNALRQNSFFLSKMKERGIFSNSTSHDLNSSIKGSGHWYLTKADSDIDFS